MEWRQSIIIPIWKRKGDRRECSQYRDISLLSQSSKVFARILEKRIKYIVEPQLSENQFGFRKNKGCSDAIFIDNYKRSTLSGTNHFIWLSSIKRKHSIE